MNVRIIPRLDIKGPNLVKGIHLEGLRVLGKPQHFAHYYYEQGADELFYLDAVASLYQRNNLLEIVEKTAKNIFIPLTVGGGLRNTNDIRKVLNVGADKVAINTGAVLKPKFVQDACELFGSSTIVVSIEAVKSSQGNYEVCTDYGRERIELDAVSWAKQVAELGAGEIMVTSIDREGTQQGFDVDLTQKISQVVSVPVIASGGAGTVDHVRDILENGGADACSLASILHYGYLKNNVNPKADYSSEGNTEFLTSKLKTGDYSGINLKEIKSFLKKNGINCRPEMDVDG